MAGTATIVTTTIGTTLLISAVLLNTLGIYLLLLMRRSLTNQRMILMNLSLAEICLSLSELTYWVLSKAGLEEATSRVTQIVVIINSGFYGSYYLIMILISVDRLVATILTLRYNQFFSPRRAKIVLVTSWVTGLCSCIPFIPIHYDYIYDIYYKIIYLTLDAVFFLVAAITYGYILLKLLRRQNKLPALQSQRQATKEQTCTRNTNNPETSQSRQNYNKSRVFRLKSIKTKERSQYFLVTSMIILSFLVFVAIPDVIYAYLFVITETGTTLQEDVILIIWEINFVLDPAIYIFLQRPIRLLLKKEILRLKLFFQFSKTSSEGPVISQDCTVDHVSTGTNDTRL